jgi:hypothetical protein
MHPKQPKISLPALIFQDFAGTFRNLAKGKSEAGNDCWNQKFVFCPNIWPGYIYTHLPAAKTFSTCHQFLSDHLAQHPGAPIFCWPGLAKKNWQSFSRRLRVTSKIGSPHFVWTSGLNIYKHAMPHQFQAPSIAKDCDKGHPYFAPAQKANSTWPEIQQCSPLALPCHPARQRQLTRTNLPELSPPVLPPSWHKLFKSLHLPTYHAQE